MWEIPASDLKVVLPPGFCLMEDNDLVYLFKEEAEVARWSKAGVNPAEIEKAAQEAV